MQKIVKSYTWTIAQFKECISSTSAVKTSSRQQAQELLSWLKAAETGLFWYVIWDDVKRGTIFAIMNNTLLYDRDESKFQGREIVDFKKVKIKITK